MFSAGGKAKETCADIFIIEACEKTDVANILSVSVMSMSSHLLIVNNISE